LGFLSGFLDFLGFLGFLGFRLGFLSGFLGFLGFLGWTIASSTPYITSCLGASFRSSPKY